MTGAHVGRTVLPATGSAASPASRSATRFRGGEPQASCREVIAPDSFHRSDSFRFAGGSSANPTPFPYQATAMGLQRIRRIKCTSRLRRDVPFTFLQRKEYLPCTPES